MNIIVLKCPGLLSQTVFSRALSTSSVLNLKQWRQARGLPANRNAEGILTDGPDYTFLDGRPTPLLRKQKRRIQKQQQYASRMVDLCSELDFAKQRHQQLEEAKEQERQMFIDNRLKPKGHALKQDK